MWVLKIIPSYCLTNSIMVASGLDTLAMVRPSVSKDNFNIQNMGGDLLILGCHFVFWTFVLFLIELGALDWINTMFVRKPDNKQNQL